MADEEFENTDAGASKTEKVESQRLKNGSLVMMKGNPCKVTEVTTAKPGKHGSAKATIVGIDIFTNKKVEDSAPTGATIRVPIVEKKEYEVADISEDGFVSLILDDGSLKENLKLPDGDEEIKNTLQGIWDGRADNAQVYFTVISSVGQEKLIAGRIKEWSWCQ